MVYGIPTQRLGVYTYRCVSVLLFHSMFYPRYDLWNTRVFRGIYLRLAYLWVFFLKSPRFNGLGL
jgi:hypothetical protein